MCDFFANLMPQPRRIEKPTGKMRTPERLALVFDGLSDDQSDQFTRLAGIVLRSWTAAAGGSATRLRIRLGQAGTAGLARVPAPLAQEGYQLEFGREIVLSARAMPGLQRGIQTLRQLMENGEERGSVPRSHIVDWPRVARRGIHFDLAREMEYRPEHMHRVVDNIAYFRMNTLHLYLENKFVYPSAPDVAPSGVMTPEQAKELCEYAAVFGITVIPQVPTMGHMEHFLNGRYERLREDPQSSFNLCPSHPDARPFLAGLIRDVAEAFHPPWIHVGYDESHSGICERCRQRGKPEQILAEHLNWLDSEVKKHGARTMIYGDKFLSRDDFPRCDAANGGTSEQARAALKQVSRDILITDWHYTAPYGGTVRHLVRQGFDVHIVTASNIFWHDSIPLNRGHHWIVETTDRGILQGASGAFHSNWEYYRGQFFDNFWFFQALAAERQWTDQPHDYRAFGSRFASRFWGTEQDYYSEIGSLLETTPTQRRQHFLDCDVNVELPWQTRLDYLEIADYVLSRVKAFRRAARRNGDTLRMLDMPAVIVRYMGNRAIHLPLAREAVRKGDKVKAVESLREVRKAAMEVAARLDEGYRIYGGAVVDRSRIRAHIEAIDRELAAVEPGAAPSS